MNLKHSKQRDSIKEFLKGRKDHPTAAVVYENVRKTIPNISLGTVYRNLTLLADIGEISRIHVGDGVDHFDADISPHYHFICRNIFGNKCASSNNRILSYNNTGQQTSSSTNCYIIFNNRSRKILNCRIIPPHRIIIC